MVGLIIFYGSVSLALVIIGVVLLKNRLTSKATASDPKKS